MGTALSKEWLEALYRKHHRLENLHPDPLVFAQGYQDPRDGEVAGLVAAAFAYGQVGKILEALETIFAVLGPSPISSLQGIDTKIVKEMLSEFSYRFHKTEDVALFLLLLARALGRWGGLRELFLDGDRGGEIGHPMALFAERILAGDARPVLRSRGVPEGHPVRFLLASPAGGGAAKRLCLFLRWMVRKDAIDPGYWGGAVDPGRLVIPLDTHVARVGQMLGLTRRKTADWKMAREITESLRVFDACDPVRYDFCLFRYGMSERNP